MNLDIKNYGEFSFDQNDEKSQIILVHTKRNLLPYLQGLKYRFNKKNKRVPHFIITKKGEILQLLKIGLLLNQATVLGVFLKLKNLFL